MQKFLINITRTDEYKVEVDDTIWDEKAIQDWAKVFYPAESPEDIARHLSMSIMRGGSDQVFMEGFGRVKKYLIDGSLKKEYDTIDGKFRLLTDEDYTKGISIKIIDEDENYDIDIN